MAVLSTRAHAVFDYAAGLFLVASPWLLGFHGGGIESWVPVGLGTALIAWSLFTDYELGAVRRIDPKVHLWMDGIAGILLAVSPWVFGFEAAVWIPHVVGGLALVAATLLSDTIPTYDRRARGGR
jgi:hypothetical protein